MGLQHYLSILAHNLSNMPSSFMMPATPLPLLGAQFDHHNELHSDARLYHKICPVSLLYPSKHYNIPVSPPGLSLPKLTTITSSVTSHLHHVAHRTFYSMRSFFTTRHNLHEANLHHISTCINALLYLPIPGVPTFLTICTIWTKICGHLTGTSSHGF